MQQSEKLRELEAKERMLKEKEELAQKNAP